MTSVSSESDKRHYVTGVIKEIYESHGFASLENVEAFQGQLESDAKAVEANAILAVNQALERLNVKDFAIYLSHSVVLSDILETVRVPETLQPKTFTAIRGFTKFDIAGFVQELQDVGVSEKAATILADLFLNSDEILNQEHDVNLTIVSNLLNIVNNETLGELGQILRQTGRKPVLIDPALPCESPFGDGVVIEARTSGLVHLGSGGCIAGRTDVFAFSFNIENIIELMDASNAFPSSTAVSSPASR